MNETPYQEAPAPGPGHATARPATVEIKYLHPLQAGKVLAVMYAFVALLMIPVFLIGPVLQQGGAGGGAAAAGGAAIVLVMLAVYPVMGFIGGVIMAWFYNIVVGFTGGIRLDLE